MKGKHGSLTEKIIENVLGYGLSIDLKKRMIDVYSDYMKEMKSLRTKETIAMKKAMGENIGRPAGGRILQGREDEIQKYLNLGINRTAMSKLMGVNPNTLNGYIKENKMTKISPI